MKLENEVITEDISQSNIKDEISQVNNQYHEQLLKDHQAENVVENTSSEEEISFTQEATTEISENDEKANNDLSEFGVDSDAPDLFNSDSESLNSNDLLSSENDEQEDDLEIPAFLRRQKN